MSSIATRISSLHAGSARLLALPTGIRDVVSFRGSFLSAPDLRADEDVMQSLVTDLLDKGSQTRDRFEIADLLDGRGARLYFFSDGLRLGFAGRCLRDDLGDVLDLASELLRQPAFDADEVEKARQKAIASVRRSTESTSSRASGAYTRRLYDEAHPNHALRPETEIARLAEATPEAIRAYHAAHLGSDGLTIVAVGDVDPDGLAARVGDAFGAWAPHGREAVFSASASPEPPGREHVPMLDKLNLDVRMGHAIALRRASEDFLPLYAGVFALGGNFSSRLMQTVRDEQGLTYGVSARLSGIAIEHDMDFRVSVSLSQDNLERGIQATREQIVRWAADGITPDELARVQTTLTGKHVVGLATTGALATRLLINAERDFGADYLDVYPDEVRALTAEQVNRALSRWISPEKLHVVTAGTQA